MTNVGLLATCCARVLQIIVTRLRKRRILTEGSDGLIVTEGNAFEFGNNQQLQKTKALLVKKLLRDLQAVGIGGPKDF